MAKTDPFANFDFARIMGEFRVPGIDMDQMLAAQRKNFEAIAAANRAAMEGMQAVTQRQAEILREIAEEGAAAMQEMLAAGAPEDKIARQAELVKANFERTLANLKELSEMMAKSNGEAFAIVNARISESLDEFRAVVKKKA